ncbi:hypothetical protein [Halogeometricum luteum]|uniref:Sulfatase n=1 Tax=Halogeometricum luteum TaxID=2950537 RepID=A0ABU2G3D6_9EURY|nr:hypothetical protein [Halogeometricum sp. S3BR5-2]MDS0295297.1 hypothetical protein [Halogeometricum sp. S3BR5-2]
MDEPWENLLILDGCRYDVFEETHRLEGTLSSVESRGSNSEEFITENFSGRTFHDTVYVSANPFTEVLIEDGVFHDVVNVFDLAWDEDLRTVTPDAVVEHTRKAYERYPDKRIISHFMQPHYPFIGETGRKMSHRGLSGEVTELDRKADSADLPIWTMLRYRLSEATLEEVWTAYAENLALVLPAVEELLDVLEGKSVVTADHGNLFGEKVRPLPIRTYGHPPGFRTPELVTVPWFVPPFERHRSVRSDPPQVAADDAGDGSDDARIEQRLRDLGYV